MAPRSILKNSTYLITRRTSQRQFFLRPSRRVNGCIRYCVARAQKRSGLQIHCIIFLSNHYHMVITDPKGKLPLFTEELHKLLGRSLNCFVGRWENFWSGNDQTSHVLLESEEEVLAKVVYCLANPTEALLVSHGPQWPGVRLFHHGSYKAKKPTFFFRGEDEGGLPDQETFTLTPPPIGVSRTASDEVVQKAVSAKEKEIRLKVGSVKRFLGAGRVKAQSFFASPRNPEPRRGMSPRLACRDKWRRIERLAQLASFVQEHREKRKQFLAGDLSAVFPAGTYLFVRQFGALCAEN